MRRKVELNGNGDKDGYWSEDFQVDNVTVDVTDVWYKNKANVEVKVGEVVGCKVIAHGNEDRDRVAPNTEYFWGGIGYDSMGACFEDHLDLSKTCCYRDFVTNMLLQ